MIRTAKNITKNQNQKHTDDQILKNIGWPNFFILYSNAVKKEAFKIINSDEDNNLKYQLICGRNRRNISYNRTAPHESTIGWNKQSQNSFVYKTKKEYNKLPKELTLCPNFQLFKKYLKLYTFDRKFKFPIRKPLELMNENMIPKIDISIIYSCQDRSS